MTTFKEYRDLKQPIIGFSEDGSLAWSIVQVKVTGSSFSNDGIQKDIDFTCAWITLYKNRDNSWLKIAEVSNFK